MKPKKSKYVFGKFQIYNGLNINSPSSSEMVEGKIVCKLIFGLGENVFFFKDYMLNL